MSDNCVFIVEDDPWYADLLEYYIKLDPEFTVEKYLTGKECLDNLNKNPLAISLDFSLPDLKGGEILRQIQVTQPDLPVIVISGQKDIKTAVDLLKEGAWDYIVKDEDTQNRLLNTLRIILKTSRIRKENETLKAQIGRKYDIKSNIIGSSETIKKVFSKVEKALDSSINVSIFGETGTGKELVARAIHYNSPRKNESFVAINLAAVPTGLIESELFGHEKGAFTGANQRRIGKMEEAGHGTIFLDEIAEMNPEVQVKLLRVLQEREFSRVGGNEPVKLKARIITATHKDLADEVKQNRFRSDLFYRLMGFPIHMPPLRDRGRDILILSKYFADEFCKENGKPKITFSEDALKKLMNHSYPGNIRELKSIIELSILMSENNLVESGNITFVSVDHQRDLLHRELSLEEYNREIIKHYLEKYDHKVITAANKLKIAKSTMYRLIRKYELD